MKSIEIPIKMLLVYFNIIISSQTLIKVEMGIVRAKFKSKFDKR